MGGHAPLKPELSNRRSSSPSQAVRKRGSTSPLLEPKERAAKGGEFTSSSVIAAHALVTQLVMCYKVHIYGPWLVLRAGK